MTTTKIIMRYKFFFVPLLAISLILVPKQLLAEKILVSVASNFTDTMKLISKKFEAKTHHHVTLISASTGKLYAQIKNGAPFDAFFAADVQTPQQLENEAAILPGSRFTYAFGKLVLWSPKAGIVDSEGKALQGKFRFLAIANPKLAPYGKAAQQVLQRRDLWNTLAPRVVKGENISQTFQFVNSGNADMGFIALSQLRQLKRHNIGSFWIVPQDLYTPIKQQAVLLRDNKIARAFMAFIRSDEAVKIMKDKGYVTTMSQSNDQ